MTKLTLKRENSFVPIYGDATLSHMHIYIYVNGASVQVLYILERPRKVKFMSRGKGDVHKKGQDS